MTAYSGASYVSDEDTNGDDQGTDTYFGASIDGNIMHNIENGYVPNREKTITKRKVRLVGGKEGNLVLENPVPSELKKC